MNTNLETAMGVNGERATAVNTKTAYRIVLVDDDTSMRRLERTICEQVARSSNYEPQIQEFPDGSDAWQYLQGLQQQPDLLLTDMNMPVMSGDELIKNARNKFPTLNVILASGGNSQIVEKCYTEMGERSGFVFISKPFDIQKLKDLVTKYAPKPAV